MKKSVKYKNKQSITVTNIGKRCRRYREMCGIRQRDLAEKFGVTQGLISQFENGKVDSIYLACLYNNYFNYEILKDDITNDFVLPF